jgi:hypothetical protein
MALDPRGITLAEVSYRYPRSFQTLGYDVSFDVDEMYKPKVLSTFEMCINAILTLLKMKPGQFPSIPELGIDVEQYLHEYSDDPNIPMTIKSKLTDQLNRLNYTGIDIQVFHDITADGQQAMIIRVEGTETLEYHMDMSPVIIGITYDQLGKLYTRIRYKYEYD